MSGWDLSDKHIAWIVRRALRTLIKKGDRPCAGAHRHDRQGGGEGRGLRRRTREDQARRARHHHGETGLNLETAQRLVIAAVHYPQKNGISRKVFKLKETELLPNADCELAISQTVKDFTTRKHNAGFHPRRADGQRRGAGRERLRSRDSALNVLWRKPAAEMTRRKLSAVMQRRLFTPRAVGGSVWTIARF